MNKTDISKNIINKQEKLRVSILGSTGSIGTQALEVVDDLNGIKEIEVVGISGNKNLDLLEQQARKYSPKLVAVPNEERAKELRLRLKDTATRVVGGAEGPVSYTHLDVYKRQDDHYTTAKDLATLTVEAMKNKTFREIVAMTQAIIPPTEKVGTRTFINTNGLLSTLKYTGYYYSYAIGVKTGHTSQAGYCLVSAAKKGNLEVVGVVMNCKSEDDRHYDSRNMLAYAIDNYKAVTAVSSGDMVGEIKVKFGSGANHTTLSTVEDIVVTIPEDANAEDLVLEPQLADYVAAPVAQGEVIGTVNVVLNGKVVGSGDLVADSTVKRHPLGFLMQFFSFIWGFAAVKVIIIALLAAIVILAIYMLSLIHI